MRIAYFTDLFLPKIDGVVTSTVNFARELGRRGHQVLIFAPKPSQKVDFKAKNVKIFFLPSISGVVYPGFRLGGGAFLKVYQKVKKFSPSLFHFQTPITVGTEGVLLAKIFEKPLVGTFHAFLTEEEYLKFFRFKFEKIAGSLKELLLSFQKFYYRTCDLAIAPCGRLKKELLRQGFKKPIEVVPNGVDLKKIVFLSNEEVLRLKKKLGLLEKVVLHFGRLSREKSIDVLLKAAKIVIEKNQKVSFLIVGSGPFFPELKKLVQKLRIAKRVKFTGPIAHEKLLSSGILTLADLFATASKMENQPMAVLEAMGAGLPIVGVRKAGLPELVGGNGFLAEPDNSSQLAEKILKILEDDKLKTRLGQVSLRRAQEFSIEKSTDKLLKVYQRLLEKKKEKKKKFFSFKFLKSS